MAFFNEVGKFFSKTIPDVVTKEIPKFVTQTVPSVFERDTYAPDLPPLRKRVAGLTSQAEAQRERYFATRGRLEAKINRYRSLSEDFEALQTRIRPTQSVLGGKDALTMQRELEGIDKTVNDIVQTTRMVATIATLGLLELTLMHSDNAEERKHLKERERALTAFLNRLRTAIAEMEAQEAKLDEAIAGIEAALAEAGLTGAAATASALRAAETADAARRDMAARLLGDGIDIDGVAAITGLSPQDIAGIAPDTGDPLPPDRARTGLTPEEIALLNLPARSRHAE